jgi:KDO2-lipid IV(A) lauroyltransferase
VAAASRSAKQRRREVRGRFLAAGLRALRAVFERLPVRMALALGALGGRLAFLAIGWQRRLAIEHIELALGPMPRSESRRIAREACENLGRNLAELLRFRRLRGRLRETVRVLGLEHMDSALARRRGVIAVASHLGSWEMLAAAICERGYPVAVVGRRPHERALFELLDELRTAYGAETIWRESDGSAKQILRVLRENRILALLIDQDTHRVPQVVAPFFGRPARTPSGAAVLALRTGAPLVPVFIRRTATGHEVEFEPAIDPSGFRGFDGDGAVVEVTAALNRVIERRIRERPEEWVWWHRRWRV